MAQSGDYDQLDDSLNDESGGKSSLFGKLKNKTKDHGKKLITKLQNKNDDTSTGDVDDETTSPFDKTGEDTGANEPQRQEPSKTTGENFPGSFAGVQDDKTQAEGDGDDTGLAKNFEGLSTNEKSESDENTRPPAESKSADESQSSGPEQESTEDTGTAAKDQTTDKGFGGGDSEQKYASPDAPAASEQSGPEQAAAKASEAGKTWTQWAAEKVGYAKDTAAAKAPTTADGTPVHEKAFDAAGEAKDSAVETATGAKDSVASQIPDKSSIPSDPAQQTYFQKATGGIYGVKDSLFSSTQPGEHDKALSQKVTESVGNLPASLKSSLGFGKSPTSPTTTPGLAKDAPAESTSEEATGAPPQSPGLVSRITGLFGAKKPASEQSSPASESNISETGSETQTDMSEPTKTE